MATYQYTDEGCEVVHVIDDDGVSRSSMLASALDPGTPILPAAPMPTERRVRDWEFRDRFTQGEIMAIVDAAYAGDTTARFVLLKIQTASDGVNLDSAEVTGGIDYLTTAGILAAGRKAEILAGPSPS